MSIGKTFEKDMLTSMRVSGFWAERFTDRMWSQGGGSAESPPDLIAVRGGCPYLLELKAKKCEKWETANIPFNRCVGHQRERLLNFINYGGRAFVGVMFYVGERAQQRRAVLIPIHLWVVLERTLGRKSLPLETLDDIHDQGIINLKWVGRKPEIGPWYGFGRSV